MYVRKYLQYNVIMVIVKIEKMHVLNIQWTV
ncbi:Uncharacterised protein [Mycobacteroides abscessus subsp. massiliense]|nr:Uncharacterised protein [Mycobacteroides abscessus subsp. massiliense]